jgi:hypothetical protein
MQHPLVGKWKQFGLLILVAALGYMPVCYYTFAWWPHNHLSRILSGPIAVIADAALVGAAAIRLSKWWLFALVAPLFGIIGLLTATV